MSLTKVVQHAVLPQNEIPKIKIKEQSGTTSRFQKWEKNLRNSTTVNLVIETPYQLKPLHFSAQEKCVGKSSQMAGAIEPGLSIVYYKPLL